MVIVKDIERLKKPAEKVKEGQDISQCVEALFRGLKEYKALGLAANQLGFNYRILVVKVEGRSPVCLVNPVITKQRGSQIAEERCLSLPGIVVSVKRPRRIVVRGLNQYLRPVRYRFNGFDARKACHEIDHLEGKLITDYRTR